MAPVLTEVVGVPLWSSCGISTRGSLPKDSHPGGYVSTHRHSTYKDMFPSYIAIRSRVRHLAQ